MIRVLTGVQGLEEAVERLREGKLVAFPTETVYGLGANALDPDAVARIFTAKGRPATNPIIVHVASNEQAKALTKNWTEQAEILANLYWPGPLTLVLERADTIPDIVTAGGNTVGIRIPAHPVALALLEKAGVPIAAPSANRSEEISPTLARHVVESLSGSVDDLLVLDGGACEVGIESTVIDVTTDTPIVLRPGMITISGLGDTARAALKTETVARSPGQRTRHYAPKKPVRLQEKNRIVPEGWRVFEAGNSPKECATRLYATLREWDADDEIIGIILCLPPETPTWDGIRDRLKRAAASS